MKTLEIRNGDLTLDRGGFGTLSGAPKVRQDLAAALVEEFGGDRFHLRWGSLLERYIGQPNDEQAVALVRGEILRVIRNYMVVQQGIIQADHNAGRVPRFGHSEVIREVRRVDIAPFHDRIRVRVHLEMYDDVVMALGFQVGG